MLAARPPAKTQWPEHELESVRELLEQRAHKCTSSRATGSVSVRITAHQTARRVCWTLCHCVCFLTEPSLLVSLHFDSEAEVCQLDGSSLHLTGQQQVLRLRRTHVEAECGTGDEDSKRRIVTGTLL